MVDYPSVIATPMDLGTVRGNLAEGMYHSVHDFAQDVRLVFENALVYWPKGHPVHSSAGALLEAFDHRMEQEMEHSDALLAEDPAYASSALRPARASPAVESPSGDAAEHARRLDSVMRLIHEASRGSPGSASHASTPPSGHRRGPALAASARDPDAAALHEVSAALLTTQRQAQALREENQQLRSMLHFGASHDESRRRRRLELAREAMPEGELQRLLTSVARGETPLAYGLRAAEERRLRELGEADLSGMVAQVVDRINGELRAQSQEHFDAERGDLALLSKDEMRLELERTRDGVIKLVQTYEGALKTLVARVDVIMDANKDTESILKENAELRAAREDLRASLESSRAEVMRLTNEAEEARHAKREREALEQMHLSTSQALQQQVHALTEEKARLGEQLQEQETWRQRLQAEREETEHVRQEKALQGDEIERLRRQLAQLTADKYGVERERDQLSRRVQLLEQQLVMTEQTRASVGL